MTRDEALATIFNNQAMFVKATVPEPTRLDCAVADLNTLVALGLLKLGSPRDADQKLAAALMAAFSFETDPAEMGIFRANLGAAGLEISEKQDQ